MVEMLENFDLAIDGGLVIALSTVCVSASIVLSIFQVEIANLYVGDAAQCEQCQDALDSRLASFADAGRRPVISDHMVSDK